MQAPVCCVLVAYCTPKYASEGGKRQRMSCIEGGLCFKSECKPCSMLNTASEQVWTHRTALYIVSLFLNDASGLLLQDKQNLDDAIAPCTAYHHAIFALVMCPVPDIPPQSDSDPHPSPSRRSQYPSSLADQSQPASACTHQLSSLPPSWLRNVRITTEDDDQQPATSQHSRQAQGTPADQPGAAVTESSLRALSPSSHTSEQPQLSHGHLQQQEEHHQQQQQQQQQQADNRRQVGQTALLAPGSSSLHQASRMPGTSDPAGAEPQAEQQLTATVIEAKREAASAHAPSVTQPQSVSVAVKEEQLEDVGPERHVDSTSGDQAQLQQQASPTGSKPILLPAASRHWRKGSSDMSFSPQPGVMDRSTLSETKATGSRKTVKQLAEFSQKALVPVAATVTAAMPASLPAPTSTSAPKEQSAEAQSSLKDLGKMGALSPTPGRDLAGVADANGTSDLHQLAQELPAEEPHHQASSLERPTRGKRFDEDKHGLALSPAPAQLMSGKPSLQEASATHSGLLRRIAMNSPIAPGSAAAILKSNAFSSVQTSPAQLAAAPRHHTADPHPIATESATDADAALQFSTHPPPAALSTSDMQAAASSQAPAPSRAKQKRIYRQTTAEPEDSPEAKRPKQAAAGKIDRSQEPPPAGLVPQKLQPPQQQMKDTKVNQPRNVREPIPLPEQPVDLLQDVTQNILRSIRKLRLQGHGHNGQQQLSSQHMHLMTHLPVLSQLRVLSKYASEVLPHGNVIKFFSLTAEAMSRKCRDPRWLAQRDETATVYKLCDAAASLYQRLGDSGYLPDGIVPPKTPQLVPLELQAAYVLCVGGYLGKLSRKEYADQLLIAMLSQVCLTMEELKASPADCKTAELNLKLAGGSPSKVRGQLQQQSVSSSTAEKAQRGGAVPEPYPLDIDKAVRTAFRGLVRLKRIEAGSLDKQCKSFLSQQAALWQLRIVSLFAGQVRQKSSNPSAFLTSICNRIHRADQKQLAWLREGSLPPHKQEGWVRLHPPAHAVLHQAAQADILPRDRSLSASIAELPVDLQCAAACYAVGVGSSDASTAPVASLVKAFVKFVQGLIHDVDPAAVPNYVRARSESLSRAPSQPKDDKAGKAGVDGTQEQSTAAAAHTHDPKLAPVAPADPRRRPPTQPPPAISAASQHQGSTAQPPRGPWLDQSHNPSAGAHLRHCKFYYRMDGGCTDRKCGYYHGTHAEYVAHMTHMGLIPYSLKFAGDVGRDRWIVDGAIDGLNDLIISHKLPRGSYSEFDLRPLAFLIDPSGEHAKLQLQVSRSPCHHVHTTHVRCLLRTWFTACLQLAYKTRLKPLSVYSVLMSWLLQQVFGKRAAVKELQGAASCAMPVCVLCSYRSVCRRSAASWVLLYCMLSRCCTNGHSNVASASQSIAAEASG